MASPMKIQIVLTTVMLTAQVVFTGKIQAQTVEQRKQLERLKKEPSCREVQEASLRYFQVNKKRIAQLQSGAASKALAPVFEVSGGYTRADIDESTDNYLYGMYPWLAKGSAGWSWEARAKVVWNLPQLIFNPEELDVASLAGLLQGILKEVTRLYYMRRRLQVDLILNPPADQATRLTKELRLEELTALIDAMTGGYFSHELEKRGLTGKEKQNAPGNSDLF